LVFANYIFFWNYKYKSEGIIFLQQFSLSYTIYIFYYIYFFRLPELVSGSPRLC